MSEHALQVTVARYLKEHLHPSVAWTSVGHEGKRGLRAQQRLKASGVRAGQADLRFILPPGGRSAEIELKKPLGLRGGTNGSKQSDRQQEWESRVLIAGGLYAVCRSLADVQETLRAWGVSLRAHPFERFSDERSTFTAF